MNIYIFEGARGVGKTTIVKAMRDALVNVVAMNFTGNKNDGEEGKKQTRKHYENVMTFLQHESFDGTPFDYIFDRFFFSEQVYSTLYKDYNFAEPYVKLLIDLDKVAGSSGNKVVVFHLTSDKDRLNLNLNGREGKADLFDNEKLRDSLNKSMEQMNMYYTLFELAKKTVKNIRFVEIDISNLSVEEAVTEIKRNM